MKKTAVIIGATGNLGTAVCKRLKEATYTIDPVWNNEKHPDASIEKSYMNLPKKINAAIYLAGVNLVKKAEDITEKEWDTVMNINLKGAFLFAKHALPGMKAAGLSTFIVISSIMATHPYPERLPYAASKAALEGLTRSLAVEWGRYNISVNCIRLGHLSGLMKSTKTNPNLLHEVKNKTPNHELIDPDEVAKYITWLVEGGGKTMSGSITDFDKGYTINRWPL
ncbi:MAG: SDR family oxidoreductase [Candidatus Gracilibacteria bacterium]|jgi:NAD(P)-dependent dehydrogenase (short-subunit alcohol dehydrogenase family)